MKRNKTPEQRIKECVNELSKEIGIWKSTYRKMAATTHSGLWSRNMNLTRNHILYYKRQIREICEENGIPLPETYYLTNTAGSGDNDMANTKQKERVARLRRQGVKITLKKPRSIWNSKACFK